MIGHKKVSGKFDGDDPSQVQPSDWDTPHVIDGVLGEFDALAKMPSVVPYLNSESSGAFAPLSTLGLWLFGVSLPADLRSGIGAAPLDSPVFINNARAPTQTITDSSTLVATTEYVTAKIAALIGGSPLTLDTLNEIATALGNDPNLAATITAALGNRLRIDTAQSLTTPQKAYALANIGADAALVRVDTAQSLSAGAQAQGRANLGINQDRDAPGTDFNAVVATGNYRMNSGSSNSPNANNYHYLQVTADVDSNYVSQVATVLTGVTLTDEKWFRTKRYNLGWRPWVRLAIATQRLPAATDINTVVNAGVYNTADDYATNGPFAGPVNWVLTVEESYAPATYTKQIISPLDGTGRIYTRTLHGGAWNAWREVLRLDASGKLPAVDGSQLVNVGVDASIRRNSAIDRAYLSKALGYPQRRVNSWATGFKAASDPLRGINTAGSTAVDVSRSASDGLVSPQANTTLVGVGTPSGGPQAQATVITMVDLTVAVPNSAALNSIGVYSTNANAAVALKVVRRNSAGNYDVLMSQTVAHPGGGWYDAPISFTTPASGSLYIGVSEAGGSLDFTGSVSRGYFSTGDLTGTGQTLVEAAGIAFPSRFSRVTSYQNMTLATVAQTVDAPVSVASALIEFDNSAMLLAGTDFTIELMCNGATWVSAAVYTIVTSNSQAGRRVIETDDITCSAGTAFAARLKTITGKNMPISALSISAR